MKFNLFINNQDVTACYTGKTARIYREQFGRDILADLSDGAYDFYQMYGQLLKEGVLDLTNEMVYASVCVKAVGAEFLERIAWACVYAGKSTTLLFDQWIDSIDNYQLFLMAAVVCFQTMLGNVSIVAPADSEESSEDEKKRQALAN